jgi:hypothetical protein
MFAGQAVELKEEDISLFVNQGGFDMLGRSSEQIHTDDQVRSSLTPYRRPSLHTPYTPDGRHSLPLGVVCISATHGICVPSTAIDWASSVSSVHIRCLPQRLTRLPYHIISSSPPSRPARSSS